MSDTPETDAVPKLLGTTMGRCDMVNTAFARSLERRLASVTDERDAALEKLKARWFVTDLDKAKEDRDAARAMLKVAREALFAISCEHRSMQATPASSKASNALARLDEMEKEANE